jgi:L-ornithine N5-monooxygenase
MSRREVELLAIGAGPSNLGLAIALEELAPDLARDALIIERSPSIEWQPGLLLPEAKSQVSFLKDLVTLRNPRSRFTFLNHLRATGRLDDFINMSNLTPYRLEISAYLDWVAKSLALVSIQLGTGCTSIRPERDASGAVERWITTLDDGSEIASRYLVIGTGRDANIPEVLADLPENRVVHSTRYKPAVARLSKELPYRIALVGSSQSAAEIFRSLRGDLPNSEVAWLMRSVGLTADQSSKFTNELYYPSYVDEFFAFPAEGRALVLKELYKTNYSCITPPMLQSLYTDMYLDRLAGRNDRRLITLTDITSATEQDGEVILQLTDKRTGEVSELRRDVIFLGTGFAWRTPRLIRALADATGLGDFQVTRGYRIALPEASPAGCYLQGVNEATHGIGDSLLSVLARRAQDIVQDILEHRGSASGLFPAHPVNVAVGSASINGASIGSAA